MRTALTQLLQIEYPIIQGAMAWVSEMCIRDRDLVKPITPALEAA